MRRLIVDCLFPEIFLMARAREAAAAAAEGAAVDPGMLCAEAPRALRAARVGPACREVTPPPALSVSSSALCKL